MEADLKEVFFTAKLLMLLFSVVLGQQVGVSLQLQGQTIPNNSLVNLDDLLYTTSFMTQPTNANGVQTLMCVTDLVACCETQGLGNWYFPDGGVITNGSGVTFRTNRDQNEVLNNQQFYGSVRLWRRFTPPERGLFHCELPDAQNVVQTLYVNILFFTVTYAVSESVAISSSGSTTAGETYSLSCSATLVPNRNPPLPDPNIPLPTFEWFYGPNSDAPLPSGLTPSATVFSSNTFTSTLQFSPLSQSHAGNYTCRLGAGGLVNSNMFTVTAPSTSVTITANFNAPLMVGQTGNTLICAVSGAENLSPTIAYQWTRNDGSTQTQVGTNSNTLTLSFVGLSDAGIYTCSATVDSDLLSSSIAILSNNQIVRIQIPAPQSVTLTSSSGNIVHKCSTITVTCEIELGPAIMESELSLLLVDAQLSKDGIPLILGNPTVTGTTFTFGATVSSFCDGDIGNYTCAATVRPRPSFIFLTGMGQLESSPFEITIGIPPGGSAGDSKARCRNEIAITVVVTILIECLLAAPIIATLSVVLCWKRSQRKLQYESGTTAILGGVINSGEEVYEEPDVTAATTTQGSFKLTECPAYSVTQTSGPLYPAAEAQLQSGYYEL